LAKFLFRNISLLTEVRKDSKFKVKVIVFTAILRFVGIELSQVSQLLAVGLYLSRLRIYNLGRLRICSLGNGRVLVRILVYRGIAVHIIVRSVAHNLRVGYILASKVNSKAA
jgi:hypothetical protein